MTKRFLVAAAATLFAAPAMAQNTSHNVIIDVPDVELLNVSDGDVSLSFAAPDAGGAFDPVTDFSATYSVTLNKQTNTGTAAAPVMEDAEYKITAHITESFGTGIALGVQLGDLGSTATEAPASGYTEIPVLNAAADNAADVKTGLSRISDEGSIIYQATADMTAVPSTVTRTVYYTLVQTN